MPSQSSRARAMDILYTFDFVGGDGSRDTAVEAMAEMLDLSRAEGFMQARHVIEMALIRHDPNLDATGATPRSGACTVSVAEAGTRAIPEPQRVESPHLFRKHTSDCTGSCIVCDGGLSICEVCNQAEADLMPNCPGF